MIGGCWLKTKNRQLIKSSIHKLRSEHGINNEFKWSKIGSGKLDFYVKLIDLFFKLDEKIHFRCIVIDTSKLDVAKFHDNDNELGFYKFYYQLLVHKISILHTYNIFCDYKSNRVPCRLIDLQDCLRNKKHFQTINTVQSIQSEHSVAIQLTDILTGAVSAKFNGQLGSSSPKMKIIERIETLKKGPICPTTSKIKKFNVFKIQLQGRDTK